MAASLLLHEMQRIDGKLFQMSLTSMEAFAQESRLGAGINRRSGSYQPFSLTTSTCSSPSSAYKP